MSSPVPAGARCGAHGEVPAVDLCQRCGRFLCGECVELSDDEVYCADCARKVSQPAALAARAALIMAGLSWLPVAGLALNLRSPVMLVLFVAVPAPTALAALVVALIEWRRIKTGASAARGRRWVLAALAVAGPLLLAMGAYFAWGVSLVLRR